MNHTFFYRTFQMSLVLFVAILTANVCKAEPATYEKNGSIHLGNMTLIMSPNGQIFITNSDGDRYDVHLSLVSQKTKKQWFSAYAMKDKKIQVNAATQKTVFTANLTEKQSESPVAIEYTLGINDRKKVEIRLRYLTEIPIEKILSLANLHIHTPRKQMAGSQIQIDQKTFQFDTRGPQESPAVNMYRGQAKRIGCFANQPDRALVLRPIKIKTFILNDYNITARDPYVEWRFVPVKNEIVFEVAPGSSPNPAEQVREKTQKKKVTLKPAPPVSADNQRYEGVDFRKENHYRVPQYNLTRNLIPNGGFEQNLKYWQFGARAGKITQEPPQGGYYHIDTQNVYQGKHALKIVVRKNQMPMCPATFGIPVETHGTYTVSFYAKTDLPGIRMQTVSTTAIWPKFIYWGYAKLTSQWKRYEFTKKAINGALHISFLPLNPSGNGHIWIDAVQLEKADTATEYTQPKILATLLTSRRDNFFEPNDKINARIRVNGPASQSVNLSVKLSDFQDTVLEQWQKTIQLDHQGEAIVSLKQAQSLPTGFYRIETILTGKNGIAMRDYDRLTVMPRIKTNSRHKQLFCVGATSNSRGDWKRRFERWKNIGIGAAIYNAFLAQEPSYLKMHKEYGIFAFGSIFIKGYKAGDLDLRATKNELLNDEQLKQVEEHAYQTALAYPWQNTWKLVNEPNTSKEKMKAFVTMLAFAKRGILRANPKARIISPDPSNMYLSSGIQWIEQFIQAGGLEVCDIIAIHPYRPTPESPSLDRDTATMLDMLDKNNYHGEVWFTEGVYHQNRMLPSYQLNVYKGCSTDHWRVGAFSYDLGIGEKMCFAYTMRSYLAALKHADRIKMFVDWGLNQNLNIDLDMTPTATNFAPNILTRLLGNADYRQTVALGMDLHCEVFEDDQQRPVAALWSSMYDVDRFRASGPTLDLSGLPTGTQIYNTMGRKLKNIPTTMELSPFPFFLRGNRGTLSELVSSLNHATIQGKQFQSILASFRLKDTTQASITLKNIRSKPFKGSVTLKDQTQARSKPLTKSLSLEAQGSWEQQVLLNWPKKGILPIDYAVKVVSNQGVSLLQRQLKMEVIRVPRLKTQPRIDGDLSDWPAKVEIPLPNRFKDFKTSPTRDKVQHTMISRQGDKDLSATLFAGWHPSGLYLAVKVRDNDHTPVADSKRFWIFDCLQLYFDGWFDAREHPNAGFDHNDQALDILPLSNGTVRVNRGVAPEQQLGFLKIGLNTKIKAAFRRTKKGYSIYEVFIPVEQLVAEQLQSGESFGFALLINDNDHDFRKRGLTLTPSGTEPYMHPELYPLMILE